MGARRRSSLGFAEREREIEMRRIREKNMFELCGLKSCITRCIKFKSKT